MNDCERFFGLTTKYSEVKRNWLNHKYLWRIILLHIVKIMSDPLNIYEKYASHLNIQTSKKEQLHMKKRQNNSKRTTSDLIHQQGKKKIIIKNEKI